MVAMLRLLSVCGVLCAALLGAGFLGGDGASACSSRSLYAGKPPGQGVLIVVGRVSEETDTSVITRRDEDASASHFWATHSSIETASIRFYDSTIDVHAVLAGSLEASTVQVTGLGWYSRIGCYSRPLRLPEGARVLLVWPGLKPGADLTAYFFDDGDAFLISNYGGEPRPAGRAAALIGAVAATAQSDEGEVARALLTALGEEGDEGVAVLAALGAEGDEGIVPLTGLGADREGGRDRLWTVVGVGLGLLAISVGGLLMGWRRKSRSSGAAPGGR